jgi:UDP-N-acetyl-D-galactosamine dehydrogenase
MLRHRIGVCNSRVLVLGLAFKENCPDLRNTRVGDIIDSLWEYGIAVDAYDPWVDRDEARQEYWLECLADLPRLDPPLPSPPPPGGEGARSHPAATPRPAPKSPNPCA